MTAYLDALKMSAIIDQKEITPYVTAGRNHHIVVVVQNHMIATIHLLAIISHSYSPSFTVRTVIFFVVVVASLSRG